MLKEEKSQENESVSGANESTDIAKNRPVKNGSEIPTNISKALSQFPNSLPDLLTKHKNSVRGLAKSIKTETEKSLPTGRDDLLNEIMARMEARAGEPSEDDIDDIGIALVKNYGATLLTARELGMSEARLRHLVKTNEALQIYHEIAQEGVKTLTDSHLIQGLRDGDPAIIRFVASRLYAGRTRGGFNIAEIGTTGYKDPLSKQLAAETEADRNQASVKVEFNFVQREVRTHKAVDGGEAEIEAIDAEFEEVKEEPNEKHN